ncbi:diguanylate cyclase [Leifsonia sp. ZF2019]|uniref:diguanylate cyclase n=1 Tax=Leifsonia sp. ZF2019 TaxID=2781978 RepID=UPI001CBD72DF|nr:diguanylate cyclase [Leifsonia sp. ZF2019]UAJ78937.1 diguanylate cyclase [Leifsonia sp. ZF2019]
MEALNAEELPCAVVVVDHDGLVVDSTGLFSLWTGLDAASLVGRPLRGLLASPESSSPVGAVFERVLHVDGSERAVVTSRAARPDGEFILLVETSDRALLVDRLAQTRSLEERTRNRLELIIQASIAFATARTEPELAEIPARTVGRSYQSEEAAVFFVDEESGAFVRSAGSDPLASALDLAPTIAAVVASGRVLLLSGTDEADALDTDLGHAMRSAGVHSLLIAPIRHEADLFGVFVCYFLHPRVFDAEAVPLADALAGQAGQAATSLRLQRRLAHAATHDETTGLPNRRLLEALVLESEVGDAALQATLFIDLDGFKAVNDSLGHHVGDGLLRQVGGRLRELVRQRDLVARYGGDEFVVVCDVPDLAAANDVAERIRLAIGAPYASLPPGVGVRASIGMVVARHGDPSWNLDSLVRLADHAMYEAKSGGGDRVVGISLGAVE